MTLFRLGFQEILTGNDLKSDHINSSNNDENKDFINAINILIMIIIVIILIMVRVMIQIIF